jgi:Spy/CpxP family protein refolding chaperone
MKNHYKFWIVLSFLVVFAAGLVSGVILEKNILNPKPERPSRDSRRGERAHFPTVNEMEEALGLSTEQQDRMRAVFQQNEELIKKVREDLYTQFRSLRDRFLEEIKAVLDPEQIQQLDAILEEYHAQRQAEAERRQHRSPQPKEEKRG